MVILHGIRAVTRLAVSERSGGALSLPVLVARPMAIWRWLFRHSAIFIFRVISIVSDKGNILRFEYALISVLVDVGDCYAFKRVGTGVPPHRQYRDAG